MAPSISVLVLCGLLGAASAQDGDARRAVPVLVELFTSEGCSSCPPADRLLARLAHEQPVPGARVIALGEHVDYWDDLGWKDSFSSPLFTRRQQDYVRSFGLTGPYTPQLVVGGRLQVVGSDESGARSAIAEVARSASGKVELHAPPASGSETAVDIRASWDGGEAEVVVALVEDRAASRVTRGENAGRTLEHVAVVRSMTKLGRAAGTFSGRASLDRRRAPGPAHAVVFLQATDGGRVYAAGSIELPSPRASTAP